MRHLFNLTVLTSVVVVFFAACKKIEPLPFYEKGTAVTLSASKTTVTPVPADSNRTVIDFSWTSPKYSTDTNNYKFVVEIDSTGKNFARAVAKEVLGKMTTSYTGRELNSILLNFGYAVGTPVSLDVRVMSSYRNNNELYLSNIVKILVTPYSDPSVLVSAQSSVSGSLATANQLSNTFTWGPSFPGYSGVVTYALQYDSAGKNFASPREIPVGPSVFSKAMTQAEMNTTALDEGVAGGSTGKIEYRIKATTAQGAVAFSNVVSVVIQTYVPLLRFYMPGSYQAATGNGNDWDPGTAPELIRDLRPALLNKMYYAYMYFPAGTEFKITQGRSWDLNYGGSGGNLVQNGPNFAISTSGVYRVTIDVSNGVMKYDIRLGRMGFVGGATGAGWDPSSVFPTYQMGAPSNNLFVGITNFAADGWKLIDNNAWNDGSNSVGETRSYGSNGGSGSTMEVNGPNFPNITNPGRYRVIWDGRDPNNIKYEISPASEMRLVGDGINQAGVNDWDPASSPQMTYGGNGVWTITVTLKANKDIKFLAGNAWGAFDYEDNSGGTQTLGTARKIKWDGGPNFKTPTVAGTYTITLNEYAQTVTIN